MNMEKLEKLFKECIEELKSIDIIFEGKSIDIVLSRRNNKRYGCCKPSIPDEKYKEIDQKGFRYVIKYNNYKKYTIEISKWVMSLDNNIIKNTIIHELIHCMPYCNNHGKEFKRYTKIINKKLGYNISRMGNKEEDFKKSNLVYEEKNNYKYQIMCKKCGSIFYRKRLSKNFIKNYICKKCLGKFNVIEI